MHKKIYIILCILHIEFYIHYDIIITVNNKQPLFMVSGYQNHINGETVNTENKPTYIMNNASKTDKKVTFDAIEKKVATMVIGSKCTYAKYNDNRNGYIGVKSGNRIVCSMFGLRNDNTTDKKSVGVTTDIFKVLQNEFNGVDGVEFVENGNSGDKTRPNKIIAPLETVYKFFASVIKYYTAPTTDTATATENK